jgi:hypothetical protein
MTNAKAARVDAANSETSTNNEDSPADFFETRFKMQMPEQMKTEFSQAYQEAFPAATGPLEADTVWDFFKKTYIVPKDSTVEYIGDDRFDWDETAKFVRVHFIENEQFCACDSDGDSCADAVVAAFGFAGSEVTCTRGFVGTKGYENMHCVAVGVKRDDGKTYYGVGVYNNIEVAEIMAATRACGRVKYAAKASAGSMAPQR